MYNTINKSRRRRRRSVLCQLGRRKKMKEVSHKKIFATAWHPGGAYAILPVIEKLIKDGLAEVVVIGYEFSEHIFSKAGIPFKTINDFGLPDVSAISMERLLGRILPKTVLLGTSDQEGNKNDVIEQTAIVAAKKLGIPSIAVLDFWSDYWKRFSDERTGKKFDILPDKIAIMDKVAEQDMLKEGFPKEVLAITGNPHFDDLAKKAENFSEEQRKKIRAEIGFSSGPLFFLACNKFFSRKLISGYWDLNVLEFLHMAIPDVAVVIRLHPRTPEEDKQKIRDYIRHFENIKLDEEDNPQRSQVLALVADLTIIEDSTIGIEAVLMKRPCISLQPGLLTDDSLIISKKGIIPVGYNIEDCIDLLKKATTPDFREQIVKKYVGFTTDGKATERVIQLVCPMLNR